MLKNSISFFLGSRSYFSGLVIFAGLCAFICTGCDNGSPTSHNVHTTRGINDVSANDRHMFQCDGVEFKVLLTQACIDQPCGLIFDVHGWLSNPDEQEGRSNLAKAALENGGYIVVQPGELSNPSSWNPETHYDIVFDFMEQAMDAFDVDMDRIHFTGFSQGGRMTWKFICDHPDILASAAPISATGSECFTEGNGPDEEVPILFVSGTNDILIRYYTSDNSWSVTDTIVGVMYDYGMVEMDADQYEFDENGDIVVDESGRIDIAGDDVDFEIVDGSQDAPYLWTRYTSVDGIVFEHLRHDNGHVYPDNPDNVFIPEEPTVPFTIGEAILQFFIQNPRK